MDESAASSSSAMAVRSETPSTSGANSCQCKSMCSRKRVPNTGRGCPCKGENRLCTEACKCGTRAKPCQNKTSTTQATSTAAVQPTRPSEEDERRQANREVKGFIETLDADMIKQLCIRSLQRGVGSMDYVDSLLIMEDEDHDGDAPEDVDLEPNDNMPRPAAVQVPAAPLRPENEPIPEWCRCGHCEDMPQELECVCCKKKECITTKPRFAKLCLDVDVLGLGIKNSADIRSDRQNNSTRAFRKIAYRHFILETHGYLGKGKRRVAPSCVVWRIRRRFPSSTGVYMGFRER